mmetsp:Transcript_26547/g.78528  ORF Transcript_26547/g.78528 Transcript_26547/m.78528 type:complete len:405 (-) Transcript_26547:23-1237(-)
MRVHLAMLWFFVSILLHQGVFASETNILPTPRDNECSAGDDLCKEEIHTRVLHKPENVDGQESRGDKGEIRNPFEFFGAFKRLGTSWKSVLDVYVETIRSAGGKDHNGDVFVDDLDAGLIALLDMIEKDKENCVDDQDRLRMWMFRAVPCDEFGRSINDLLSSFLLWSVVEGAQGEECGLLGGINRKTNAAKINVSKAFRRVEAYAAWMDVVEADLLKPSLTAASVKKSWDAFRMRITYDDCRRIVWWMDLGRADMTAIKDLPPKDIMRLFVWVSHLIIFQEEGMKNGIVFIDNMSHVSFWDYMTMLPLQLGMKLDKFMINCTPLQTKLVVFMNRPVWADIGYGILSVFLTKETKNRVNMVHGDRQSAVIEVVGECCVPEGFNDLNGKSEVDDIAELQFQQIHH